MKGFKQLFTLIILAFVGSSFVSKAANVSTCDDKIQRWKSDNTTMYLNTRSFPVGSSWDLHTQYMMSEWNAVGGSNFKYYVGRDTDGSVSSTNGKNEIAFMSEPNETHLAVNWKRWDCYWLFGTKYGFIESDIYLNTRYSWTLSDFTGWNTSSPYNFELVMLHELGHGLGLNHQNNRPSIMNQYYYNSGPNGHYNKVEPHADDRHGVRYIYPDNSTDRDVSVSRFKNTGASSAVNRLLRTSGSYANKAKKGEQLDVEYLVENLGTQTESAKVQFFISTNTYISTGDISLGYTTWTLPKGTHAQSKKRITIPLSMATGNYYIGYIVDPDRNIPESSTQNNSVSLLDKVYIY